MSSIILRIIMRYDREGVLYCRLLHNIPHAGHSAVSRRRRHSLAVLDSVGLSKHLLRKIMPCPTGSVPLLTYEAMRHCRVCSLGILDGSAPCCIELVVFSQHVCPCRWRAVCALEESPDARDGMVLPQTPSWRTIRSMRSSIPSLPPGRHTAARAPSPWVLDGDTPDKDSAGVSRRERTA